MVTKQAILNYLQRKKNDTEPFRLAHYTIGALQILVYKDIITVADIEAAFPELADLK